jgi:DNA-binding transcriptional MerR regulator
MEALSIGRLSALTGVEVHTLRYWETVFAAYLTSERTAGGQRRYPLDSVGKVFEIKRLLKEQRYTIAGAQQILCPDQLEQAA